LFSESTLTDPEQRDHPIAVIIEYQVCRDIGAKCCAIHIRMPLLNPSNETFMSHAHLERDIEPFTTRISDDAMAGIYASIHGVS